MFGKRKNRNAVRTRRKPCVHCHGGLVNRPSPTGGYAVVPCNWCHGKGYTEVRY